MERNCREIAVMEISPVGVTTRNRARSHSQAALSMAVATRSRTSKKRKVNSSDQLKFSSSFVKIRRRSGLITPENSVWSSVPDERAVDLCCGSSSSSRSDHDDLASCCSSNEEIKFVDLEDEGGEVESIMENFCRRRETLTTPSSELGSESEDLESMAKTLKPEPQSTTAKTMPTKQELDEFFSEAERNIQKHFTEKYNFDFVNNKPLEGRYEWIKQNPEEKKKQ